MRIVRNKDGKIQGEDDREPIGLQTACEYLFRLRDRCNKLMEIIRANGLQIPDDLMAAIQVEDFTLDNDFSYPERISVPEGLSSNVCQDLVDFLFRDPNKKLI